MLGLRSVTRVRKPQELPENPMIYRGCYGTPPILGTAESGLYPIRRYITVTLLLTRASGLTWLVRVVYFKVTT